MKLNISKYIQLIKKYKYFILLFIVAIIFYYNSSSIVEGLTGNIGEYEYLAPPPSTDTIDDEMWKKFLMKFFDVQIGQINKKPNGPNKETMIKGVEDQKKKLSTDNNELQKVINEFKNLAGYDRNVTKSELDYYINNGKFPYNGYVMNFINKSQQRDFFVNFSQIMAPNRVFYKRAIYDPDESKQNPLPLSAKIYLGQEKPPSASSTVITNDISAIKSNSNYSELVSLCKKVMKN